MNTNQNAIAAATFADSQQKRNMSRRLAAALCGVGVLFGTAASAAPVTVAILDGSSGSMSMGAVAAQLNDDTFFNFTATVLSGSTVTSMSDLSAYNVVLLGGSGYSNSEYLASTLAAVNGFMQSGGGVVTAGWYRYGAIHAADQAAADAITPVVTGGNYNYAHNTTVSFTNSLHAITTGVTDFGVSGCCVEVASALDLGASSLATANGQTVVAYQDSVGRSVYLGVLYSANEGYNIGGLRTGAADRLLEQSVSWAANGAVSLALVNSKVPEPGSLALVLAAVTGLALTRRRA